MSADRNLLLGILALQNDFISRDQLVSAMNDWVLARQTPLANLLERKGFLDPDCRALLDELVDKRLSQNGGDVAACIARIDSAGLTKSVLAEVHDEHVKSAAMMLKEDCNESSPTRPFADLMIDPGSRFTIVRPHAAGGLGEVFVARDNELNREVALKRIKEQFAVHPQQQSRFKLEAEVTGGLEHPGIVPIYSLGSYADGRPFYVMRFIQGESFKAAIDRFHRRLPGGSATVEAGTNPYSAKDFTSLEFRGLLRRLVDICNAIAYAHSRGVLHRDLKPSNVMLGKFGETLVVDWGLSKVLGKTPTETVRDASLGPLVPPSVSGSGMDATLPGSAIGTPAYMSPEQAAGRLGELGPATDVYSLGATLYTVLTGRPPFSGKAVIEILEKVRAGDFPVVRDLQPAAPRALAAICAKAMALKPDDRYSTALELAAELERWLADEPVDAMREPAIDLAKRWVRKNAAIAGGVAAALLVGATSLTFGLAIISSQKRQLTQKNNALNAALARESSALRNAQVNEALARTNEKRAEAEFRRAKGAIDEYFTQVSESKELKSEYPGMHEFRMKLLEKAAGYYDEFLKQRNDDPALRSDAALAHFNRAVVASEIGRKTEALASFASALAIQEGLVRDDPANAGHAVDLASTHINLGNVQRETGNGDAALASYSKAAEIYEKLMRATPAEPRFAFALARSHSNMGVLRRTTGDVPGAIQCFTRAAEILESLAENAHFAKEFSTTFATVQINLGSLRHATGDQEAAQACFSKAIAVLERTCRENPRDAEYAVALAFAYVNLASLQGFLGDSGGAIFSAAKSLAIREKLAVDNPAVAEFAAKLAGSHHLLGELKHGAGDLPGALANYNKAVEIREKLTRDNPTVGSYAGDLAASHNNLGNLQKDAGKVEAAKASFNNALAILRKLAKENPATSTYCDGLARTHNNLAVLEYQLGNRMAASEHYATSLALQEKLAAENPSMIEYQIGLAFTCCNVGILMLEADSPQSSLQHFDKAVTVLSRYASTNAASRSCLQNSHWNRARAYAILGRIDRSLADYDDALKLSDKEIAKAIVVERDALIARKKAEAPESRVQKPSATQTDKSSKSAEKKSP